MIETLKAYILSVASAVMIICAIQSLLPEGSIKAAAKLGCGAVLALTVLTPFSNFQLPELSDWADAFSIQGDLAAADGEKQYQISRNQLIKQQLETYILDRGASFGAHVKPEVILSEEGIPVECSLYGPISSDAKASLEACLETELGISKENQRWIG